MIRHLSVVTAIILAALCESGMAQSGGQDRAASAAPQALPVPPNTMEERVRACVSCHGEKGSGASNVYFPRLAGKPAGYLYHQLVAFRDGWRKYAPMNYLLAYLPDDYLRRMAQYYADAHVPYPPPEPSSAAPALLERGRDLVMHGAPGRNIPACVSCHGPDLTGREPGIPALIGLRGDYITAQLGAWRYGTRSAVAPDCMQLVAARMTEEDVTAAAAWLSAMPIPQNTQPLPRSPARLPLACGSQQH